MTDLADRLRATGSEACADYARLYAEGSLGRALSGSSPERAVTPARVSSSCCATLYKTLNGTKGAYGYGDYAAYLPTEDGPGEWLPPVKPVLCRSGYHVCRTLEEVVIHLGRDLYEPEVRGDSDEGEDKAAWEQIRLLRRVPEWNEQTLRLFAVDCARLAVSRYGRADQRGLLNACLDVYVARAEFGDEWDAAADAAAYIDALLTAGAAYAAACAAARAAARAAYAAEGAARTEQAALLARYLAGEVGPFVEEAS